MSVKVEFKIIKIVKEVYGLDKKYLGDIPLKKADREIFGYQGRLKEVLEHDITTSKKKKLKKGDTVFTEMQQICGVVLKN